MYTYIVNKKGYEFIRSCLNQFHVDSVNGDWQDGEFDSAIAHVEKDANFDANGRAPEFCEQPPKFHMLSGETKSGEHMHIEMTWDMFKHEYYNHG